MAQDLVGDHADPAHEFVECLRDRADRVRHVLDPAPVLVGRDGVTERLDPLLRQRLRAVDDTQVGADGGAGGVGVEPAVDGLAHTVTEVGAVEQPDHLEPEVDR
jgi:hypothetical protein